MKSRASENNVGEPTPQISAACLENWSVAPVWCNKHCENEAPLAMASGLFSLEPTPQIGSAIREWTELKVGSSWASENGKKQEPTLYSAVVLYPVVQSKAAASYCRELLEQSVGASNPLRCWCTQGPVSVTREPNPQS